MSSAASSRLPFLDGLRVAAFGLLIPYHVGMYYVTWDWHVKSSATSDILEPFMLLISPWRLGLLFLIAGAACQGLFTKRGATGAVKDRTLRLMLPLMFGMAIVVPPQTYFELMTKSPELLPGDGGYLDFWRAYLQGGQFCRGNSCLDVPTWNHLWFLPYLWIYAVAATALTAMLRWHPRELVLPGWGWLLMPALPLSLAAIFVQPHFPPKYDLVSDLYNHLHYGWLFAMGWIARTRLGLGLWAAALSLRWIALGLAIACWAVLPALYGYQSAAVPPDVQLVAARALRAFMTWWSIVAACGWAQRAFTHESPRLREFSGAVFCLYILHQSVIVVLSQWVKPLGLIWSLEALTLVILTFGLCALAYLVLRRAPGLALLAGIQHRRSTPEPRTLRATVDAG